MKKTTLIAIIYFAINVTLNSATAVPLVYDILSWFIAFLGFTSDYDVIILAPYFFYTMWFFYFLIVVRYAVELGAKVISVLAVKFAGFGNKDLSNPNTVTENFKEENSLIYRRMMDVSVIFILVCLFSLYTMHNQFERIQKDKQQERLIKQFEMREKS